MYIWDALYGKIEFSPLIYRCMLTPEVQRLREVRLCNINSLCITGSANTNRFEHSVGTAYLAKINIESFSQKRLNLSKQDKENFVIAALLHDIANGPFGHSYEYIREKKGFVPEQGLNDVFSDNITTGSSSHKNTSPFETIFFGKLRELTNLLDENQKETISQIISGHHFLSKLISDSIDLDNIDNVFRMAYHMGIPFRKEAPKILAESMYIKNGNVLFNNDAESYLNEWYSVRQKMYKFLLLNPQEFSGKYMLTEAMDILFECISQGKNQEKDIHWNYSDYQLMEELRSLKEVWIRRKTLLYEKIDNFKIKNILDTSYNQQARLKNYLEGLTLSSPIKDKGKTGESYNLQLDENFTYEIKNDGTIEIKNRSMKFEINGQKLYKVVNICYNASNIISRLMTGNLYHCLSIIETPCIEKYPLFLEYSKRISIENEIESKIRSEKGFSSLSIGLHPILDVNKTERQLHIKFDENDSYRTIGDSSSKKLLIGIFIKNEPYGLSHLKPIPQKRQEQLIKIVMDYFSIFFNKQVKVIPLYKEADEFGA